MNEIYVILVDRVKVRQLVPNRDREIRRQADFTPGEALPELYIRPPGIIGRDPMGNEE